MAPINPRSKARPSSRGHDLRISRLPNQLFCQSGPAHRPVGVFADSLSPQNLPLTSETFIEPFTPRVVADASPSAGGRRATPVLTRS